MFRWSSTRNHRISRARRARGIHVEPLESRALLATYTVVNANDSGAGSLAQAILDANGHANVGGAPDTIAFDIPGGGVRTIAPQNPLPVLSDPVVIDGYTQPGAGANSNPIDQPDNAVLEIKIDGSHVASGQGLVVGGGAAGSTIEGLVIDGFDNTLGAGITLSEDAGGNHVAGNFIGTDSAGAASTASRNYYGVYILGPDNVIGGTSPADRNVISANHTGGVYVGGASAARNLIEGNYVGLKIDGMSAFPLAFTQRSIQVDHADGTTIGGITAPARNVIAGLPAITLTSASNTTIQGNFVGTDRTGTAPVYSGEAIVMTGSSRTQIGGIAAGAGNTLGGNTGLNQIGIQIDLSSATTIQGNFIGTDATQAHNIGPFDFGVYVQRSTGNTIGGTTAGAGNVIANDSLDTGTGGSGSSVDIPITGGPVNDVLIEGNSFYGNDGPAIAGSNVTAPVITQATATTIAGHIVGTAGATYRVEYYATPNTGGSSTNQAKTLLGSQDNLVADPSGDVALLYMPPGGVPVGEYITASATRNEASTSGVGTGVLAAGATATPTADLGADISASPSPVAAGGTLTYTITVHNMGPDAALQAALTTAVPAGTTFVSLAAPSGWDVATPAVGGAGAVVASLASLAGGGQAVFTLTVKVDPGAVGGSTIDWAGTVSSTTDDPDPANQTIAASTRVAGAPTDAPVATQTYLTSSADPSTVHGSVTFTARVAGASGVPSGSVTFLDGTTPIGVVPLDASGLAVFTTSTLGAGSHTIKAAYGGDSAFAASGDSLAQVVQNQAAQDQQAVGPRVVLLLRVAHHRKPPVLVATFNTQLDAASARNRSNYTIVRPNGRTIRIRSVVYAAASRTVTIHPSKRLHIHRTYSLRVNGSSATGVRGLDGTLIDGSGSGHPGTDYRGQSLARRSS